MLYLISVKILLSFNSSFQTYVIVPINHFQINSAGALVKEVSNYNFTGYEHMISKIKNKDATKPLKRFDTMRCAF